MSEEAAAKVITPEMKESAAYKYAEQHIDELLHHARNGFFEMSHTMTLDWFGRRQS